MIFAAYSCVEVFFTHLRTTEKAPLEGEGGKNWDTEHSRVTQTCFRSEDRHAPISLQLKSHTLQHNDHHYLTWGKRMWPLHDTEQMCVEDHCTPTPTSSHWAKQQPNLRLYIRSWWAMLKTHTCCITRQPCSLAKRTREGNRERPCPSLSRNG